MLCPNCKTQNPAGKKFCGDCGVVLGNPCPKCSADNPAGKGFCGECGTGLSASTPKTEAAPAIRVSETPAPETVLGERKTVTALFADIKGSTELQQDLDPEDARAIIDPALNLMIEAVRRYDGYVVQSTGDGIFALFGAPVAHEDHPQRALYAALRLQEELGRYSAKLRETGNAPLEARVGVNTGEVVVRPITTGDGHTEYTPIGHTANLASRMQTLAATGSIAISEQTRLLCEGYFALKALGPARVKGVSEPVNVYEVTGLGPLRTRLQRSAGRGFSKFVGRQREIEAMKSAAALAQSGRGQIVAAIAEAGVGKSRLLFEFKATSQAGWMVLETFSVSHGKASAYMPLINLLNSYFRIEGTDDQRVRREKVAGRLSILDPSLEDVRPYLFSLLGIVEGEDPLAPMDGQLKTRRTLEAIKRILLRESLSQPLMLIFEDLHWIDEATQAFLDLLAGAIGTARIALLVNYRPEYSHQWNSKTYYTQLRIDPLAAESADEMLTALLGAGAELAPLRRLIIERTEGNPFFMEETVLALFEDGALTRNGAVKLTRALNQLRIPPTVQAILASRIDKLEPALKDLLQTLAVIGTSFTLGLARKVTGKPGTELERMLSQLQLGEFIYEQPALGDIAYVFKHALTHDVTYHSVLAERRRPLHERIGEMLEALHVDSLDDHVAEIAHHYGRSANVAKAVEYLRKAATQAEQRSAPAEAIAHLNRALVSLKSMEEGPQRVRLEIMLQVALGSAYSAAKSPAAVEVGSAFNRARELCLALGDHNRLFAILLGLRWFHFFRGEAKEDYDLCCQLVVLAETERRPARLVWAYTVLGATLRVQGRLGEARDAYEKALEMSADLPIQTNFPLENPATLNLWNLSLALHALGYPDQALKRCEQAVQMAREAGKPYALASALQAPAQLHLLRGNVWEACRAAEELSALGEEWGFQFFSANGALWRGIAYVELGRTDEGFVQIECAAKIQEATGTLDGPSRIAVPLAAACLRTGDSKRGLEILDSDRAWNAHPGYGGQAMVSLLEGQLILQQDPGAHNKAEKCFRKAIDTAKLQKEKSLELRATTSLAGLLDKLGKRDEARAMLAEIHGWFTEGFDTADLKNAKALLEALG